MNETDKIRFARYYPEWKKNNPTINESSDDSSDEGTITQPNESIQQTDKLGYIGNITVDKDKLINSVISVKGDAST
jgi:hypothetical protein